MPCELSCRPWGSSRSAPHPQAFVIACAQHGCSVWQSCECRDGCSMTVQRDGSNHPLAPEAQFGVHASCQHVRICLGKRVLLYCCSLSGKHAGCLCLSLWSS